MQDANTAKHGPWRGDQHAPQLQRNWVWVPGWRDSSADSAAGRFVTFVKRFSIDSPIKDAVVRCSADTRYKLFVNGQRAAVGPTRSSETIWYYDTLDLKDLLRQGDNELKFVVLRFFPSHWGSHPFVRTHLPGLTVVGEVHSAHGGIDLKTDETWEGREETSIGLNDVDSWDVFLQVGFIRNSWPPFRTFMFCVWMLTIRYTNASVQEEMPPTLHHVRSMACPNRFSPVAITANSLHGDCSPGSRQCRKKRLC